MSAGHVPTSPISDLYNNTTSEVPASPTVMDAAIGAIVETVNDNYDKQVTDSTTHKSAAILDHPDSSVTTAKIANSNVTTAKIAPLAVTSDKIATGAVGADQLDPGLLENFGSVATQAEFTKRGVNIQTYGAVSDGVTDCYAAFVSAAAAAGATGKIMFPQNAAGNAVYYFVTAPTLTGGQTIDGDEGVTLSLPSTNGVTFGNMKNSRKINIRSRDRNNTGVMPANAEVSEWLAPLLTGDITKPTGVQNPTILNATTFDFRRYSTISDSHTAFSPTVTSANQVDFPANTVDAGAGAGLVGVCRTPAKVGKEYIAAFKASASINNNGRGGILIAAGSEWALFSQSGSLRNWYLGVKKLGVAWSEGSNNPLLPSGAYTIQAAAQPIISARIVSLTEVEFFINGMFVTRYTTSGGYIEHVGFGFNAAANNANALSLYNFIEADCPERNTGDTISLAVFGDSITYGEGSNLPWPNILKHSLRGLLGIPNVSYTNYAVSGQKAAEQLAIMQGVSLVGKDYTLILVGTNDIQGQITYSTYYQNLVDMITKVRADGSVPILGVPPMYIDSGSTGYGFGALNYGQGGIYRTMVLRVAAELGVLVADVNSDFGKIDALNTQLRDNIHPNSFADTYIARSFATAIAAAEKGKSISILPTVRREGTNVIARLSAMPTSGYWRQGDYVHNTAPSVLGSASSQYTIRGWTRITTGATNVLNTDWVEDRGLTGT